ncbi:hypothetical protein GCM10010844_30440 [Deinococcus radiotolerans]|uniref:Uncharacterized protein n=1 Tax=Deinococcus radiotolerans TaxID=1309407 RepID=A0ABQ2FMP6_9DEIO|nr:hypothetical protein GCM10010844_30440 [Deinococcus radiotolerans]
MHPLLQDQVRDERNGFRGQVHRTLPTVRVRVTEQKNFQHAAPTVASLLPGYERRSLRNFHGGTLTVQPGQTHTLQAAPTR